MVTLLNGNVGAVAQLRAVLEYKDVLEAVPTPLLPTVAEIAMVAGWSPRIVRSSLVQVNQATSIRNLCWRHDKLIDKIRVQGVSKII